MSYLYRLEHVTPLGEPHELYGQSYWAQSPESDLPLHFVHTETVEAGSVIEAAGAKQEHNQRGDYDYIRLERVQPLGEAALRYVRLGIELALHEIATENVEAGLKQELRPVRQGVFRIERKLDRIIGDEHGKGNGHYNGGDVL